jgi:hypothetical protein
MALQPHVGSWLLFSFLILYTDGRISWTGDQPVARPLPKHRTTQTQNKRMHTPNIHVLSGIWSHDHSVRASEDNSCLRPRGYRDRQPVDIVSRKTVCTNHITAAKFRFCFTIPYLLVNNINMAAIQATQLHDQHFIRNISVVLLITTFLSWTGLYLVGSEFDFVVYSSHSLWGKR